MIEWCMCDSNRQLNISRVYRAGLTFLVWPAAKFQALFTSTPETRFVPEQIATLSFIAWILVHLLFFFFSSRRRHTRSDRDWSSDVCSSDLEHGRDRRFSPRRALSRRDRDLDLRGEKRRSRPCSATPGGGSSGAAAARGATRGRSEERRVGEEGRSRGSPYH